MHKSENFTLNDWSGFHLLQQGTAQQTFMAFLGQLPLKSFFLQFCKGWVLGWPVSVQTVSCQQGSGFCRQRDFPWARGRGNAARAGLKTPQRGSTMKQMAAHLQGLLVVWRQDRSEGKAAEGRGAVEAPSQAPEEGQLGGQIGVDELSASLQGCSTSGHPHVHPLSPWGGAGRRLTAPQGRPWLLLQSGLGAACNLPSFPHTFCTLPHLCFFPFSLLKCKMWQLGLCFCVWFYFPV